MIGATGVVALAGTTGATGVGGLDLGLPTPTPLTTPLLPAPAASPAF